MKKIFYLSVLINLLIGQHLFSVEARGGVALTFDDAFIDSWYDAHNVLKEYGWRATFFVTRFQNLSAARIEKLRVLRDYGHEIAHHGASHRNALTYVNEHGIDAYLENEIFPMAEQMKEEGFNPTAFAYPFGTTSARNAIIDEALLQHFKIVRGTGGWDRFYDYYNNNNLILGEGIDMGSGSTPEQWYINRMVNAKNSDRVVIFFAHDVAEDATGLSYTVELQRLIRFCEFIVENNMRFMTISELSLSPPTNTVTLTINKDDILWNNHDKNFRLQHSEIQNVSVPMSVTDGILTAKVSNGTWKIYDGDTYTQVNIDIDNNDDDVTLDYYTVSFDVTHVSPASNSTIKATYDGNRIESGAVVLSGKELVITATGVGKYEVFYLWSGMGTNNQTTAQIVTGNLNSKVNALCTVIGSKINPTYTIPTDLTATYGDRLSSVILPAGWNWEGNETGTVGNAGTRTHRATFTPEDQDNYNVLSGIDVEVNVAKATVEKPSLVSEQFVYDGTPKTVALTLVNTELYILGGDIEKTNVGDFTATVTLTDPDNYKWYGEAEETESKPFYLNWSIICGEHDFVRKITLEANCERAGAGHYECSVCGEKKADSDFVIPMLSEDDCLPNSIRDRDQQNNQFGILVERNPVTGNFAEIFVRTPEPATINLRIMDNLGNVVWTTTAVGANHHLPIVWNLRNQAGRFVANGTYLVIVEATGVSEKTYRYSAQLGVKR